MQSSLTISTHYATRLGKSSRSQMHIGARKNNRGRYLLIGGGILTLPIVMSLSVLHWIVKQNWTMLPL